jgi:hypothetical protein
MSNLPVTDIHDVDASPSLDLSNLTNGSSSSTSFSGNIRPELPSLANPARMVVPEENLVDKRANSNDASFVTPKKRKIKLLPPELAVLNETDLPKFQFINVLDTNAKSKNYGNDIQIAKTVYLHDGSEFELSKLTIDQIRSLVKNLGIVNCGSASKFNCCKAIASFVNYQNQLSDFNLKPTTHANRLTSSLCRAINIVFSDMFIADFLTVNDRKNRMDHENQTTNKMFWIRASDEHNRASEKLVRVNRKVDNTIEDHEVTIDSEDDDEDSVEKNYFSKIVNEGNDIYLKELIENKEINLNKVMQFDSDAFKKKITNLFKIRNKMKENMTTSGTHDNNAWNFVEAAMRHVPGYTKISVYYFHTRCEQNPGVEAQFVTFLDDSLKGDTLDLCSPESEDRLSAKKKRAAEEKSVQKLVDQSHLL